jgi:hypothetical protein
MVGAGVPPNRDPRGRLWIGDHDTAGLADQAAKSPFPTTFVSRHQHAEIHSHVADRTFRAAAGECRDAPDVISFTASKARKHRRIARWKPLVYCFQRLYPIAVIARLDRAIQ